MKEEPPVCDETGGFIDMEHTDCAKEEEYCAKWHKI